MPNGHGGIPRMGAPLFFAILAVLAIAWRRLAYHLHFWAADIKTFRGTQSSWKGLDYKSRPQDQPYAEGLVELHSRRALRLPADALGPEETRV